MLRRIPAVGWAINRLRPAHDPGAIDMAPAALEQAPVHGAETVATPDLDTPRHGVTVDVPASTDAVDQPDTTSPVIADVPSAAIVEVAADDARAPAQDVETAPIALVPASRASDTVDSPPAEGSVSSDERSVEVEAEVEVVEVPEELAPPVEAVAPVEMIATTPVEDSAPVPCDDVSPVFAESALASQDEPEGATVLSEVIATEIAGSDIAAGDVVEPAEHVETTPVALAQASNSSDAVETLPVETSLIGSDDQSVEVEEIPAALAQPVEVTMAPVESVATATVNDSAPVPADVQGLASAEVVRACAEDPEPAIIVLEPVASEADDGRSDSERNDPVAVEAAAEAIVAAPLPESRSQRTPRRKTEQPADRTALIRQRWAETGIRMWNPRLHGAGNATLNIQGRIELLPPADGETMPRYDKLEFKLLGGQIVCEGVIVEAPAPAAHRSFSQLAEPRPAERAREPARARQAALA